MGQLKGRKIRDLSTGKWYVSKNQLASSSARSAARLASFDSEAHMAMTAKSCGKKAVKRRSAAAKRYYKRNPGAFSKRALKFYENNPELREKRRKSMIAMRPDLENWLTDPKNCQKHFNSTESGVKVVKVLCERTKSTGVVQI